MTSITTNDMDLKHLDTASMDGSQFNLEALYKIAPSCFTEVKDEETGELKHKVDFDALRELLGDNSVEGAEEMYRFTWPGKREARREAARSIDKTLRPVVEDSKDWDTTQNLYIEGDNLEALKLLQRSYLGKVKMIYIDPPYNTGNDFVYDDDFSQSAADYDAAAGNVDELGRRYRRNTDSNGRFHSDWCSMIYSRLLVARTLLTEDGVIFISIDEHESHNLRKICDDVFGESNFLAQLVWEKRYTRSNNAKRFTTLTEPIICYCKNSNAVTDIKEKRNEKADSIYTNPDNDPRGVWTSVSYVNPATKDQRPNLAYSLFNPILKKEVIHPTNAWKYERTTYEQHVKENRLYWGKDGENTYPRLKKFLSEMDGGMVPVDLWKYEQTGSTDVASKELEGLLGRKIFDFPKPKELIMRIVSLIINGKADNDSIILDFFSGSATTAHAVMQLNAEDGGKRKFILVQLPEETAEDSEAHKAGYKNICEIGKERIRRAGKKIIEEIAERKTGADTDGGLFSGSTGKSDSQEFSLDTGFRVLRIDESNYREVKLAPQDYDQQQLDFFADNIRADRTDMDLLFGCLTSWGLPLSLPMTSETVGDCTIHTINGGDLVACFSENVGEDVCRAIAEKHPSRIVFRDSCFKEDKQKINIFEQFKQLLDWSEEDALANIRVI